jgi:hypothetical protein
MNKKYKAVIRKFPAGPEWVVNYIDDSLTDRQAGNYTNSKYKNIELTFRRYIRVTNSDAAYGEVSGLKSELWFCVDEDDQTVFERKIEEGVTELQSINST